MTISVYDKVENCGKRRKCWIPAFSPFPSVFYSMTDRSKSLLSSANGFNLVASKLMSFGKELFQSISRSQTLSGANIRIFLIHWV